MKNPQMLHDAAQAVCELEKICFIGGTARDRYALSLAYWCLRTIVLGMNGYDLKNPFKARLIPCDSDEHTAKEVLHELEIRCRMLARELEKFEEPAISHTEESLDDE